MAALKVGDAVRLTDDAVGRYPEMWFGTSSPSPTFIILETSDQIARRLGIECAPLGNQYVGGVELRHLVKVR